MSHVCAHCGKPVSKTGAELRRAEKQGLRLFCDRACAYLGKTIPVAKRFWAMVDKRGPDECWNWLGAKHRDGYGVTWDGERTQKAHRLALRLAGIEPPDRRATGLVVDHLCRNRACVNVAHMRIVSQRTNTLENNESPFAINKRKTHCKQGHPLSGDNIRIKVGVSPNGSKTTNRLCLACYGPGGIRKGKNARKLYEQM